MYITSLSVEGTNIRNSQYTQYDLNGTPEGCSINQVFIEDLFKVFIEDLIKVFVHFYGTA